MLAIIWAVHGFLCILGKVFNVTAIATTAQQCSHNQVTAARSIADIRSSIERITVDHSQQQTFEWLCTPWSEPRLAEVDQAVL